MWELRRLSKESTISLPLDAEDDGVLFRPLSKFQEIQWDYERSAHSSLGHPLEGVRDQLRAMRLPDSEQVRNFPNGRNVRYAGIVICRQRPGAASGVVLLTLEDEMGFVNLIVWPAVYEKYATLIKTTTFLGIKGKLQKQSGVAHLIAQDFWRPQLREKPVGPKSHDFR